MNLILFVLQIIPLIRFDDMGDQRTLLRKEKGANLKGLSVEGFAILLAER
jgi:hypothetical protein